MKNRIDVTFTINGDLKFDYKLKCNPHDEEALNQELSKYEEVYIYNNFKDASILEELFSESLDCSDGMLEKLSIDSDDCWSDYDFKDEKIIVSTRAKAELCIFTNRDDIDDYLDDIDFKSDNCNLCINNYEIDGYYLDSSF